MRTRNDESNKDVRQEGSRHFTRRAFLRDGFLAAGMTGFAIRAVLAQARKAKKPAFTEATVNRLAARGPDAKYHAMLDNAQLDLKSFMRTTFYLTPQQERQVSGLSPEQVQAIQKFLKESMDNKRRVKMTVSFGPPPARRQKDEMLISFRYHSVRNSPRPTAAKMTKKPEGAWTTKTVKLTLSSPLALPGLKTPSHLRRQD